MLNFLTTLASTLCGLSVPVCVQVAVGVSHASMRGSCRAGGLPAHIPAPTTRASVACGFRCTSPWHSMWHSTPLALVAPNVERPTCSPGRCILTPSILSAGAPPSDLHAPPGAGASGGPGRRDRYAIHGESGLFKRRSSDTGQKIIA